MIEYQKKRLNREPNKKLEYLEFIDFLNRILSLDLDVKKILYKYITTLEEYIDFKKGLPNLDPRHEKWKMASALDVNKDKSLKDIVKNKENKLNIKKQIIMKITGKSSTNWNGKVYGIKGKYNIYVDNIKNYLFKKY